ncbi:hypothetical protein [Pseudoprimorskyibacter insulae]|uniref:Uncharacterized protein n=1 Tax=Pseudoprimorskyibacter insulae TaxID=1695997 RepID=A0A2R8AXF2_9RHOB|nr:hypothetical protein [Pseudoprimorskyibacter insulae]SPF80554.1 hypothetical protein PRI8871_02364 [Pseudoprimorskyibacter insulae]
MWYDAFSEIGALLSGAAAAVGALSVLSKKIEFFLNKGLDSKFVSGGLA